MGIETRTSCNLLWYLSNCAMELSTVSKASEQIRRGSGFYPRWRHFLLNLFCSSLSKSLFATLPTLYNLRKTRMRIQEEWWLANEQPGNVRMTCKQQKSLQIPCCQFTFQFLNRFTKKTVLEWAELTYIGSCSSVAAHSSKHCHFVQVFVLRIVINQWCNSDLWGESQWNLSIIVNQDP